MARKQWGFNPDSGGAKIPERKKQEVRQRIEHLLELALVY
jgi:hypothetical protein